MVPGIINAGGDNNAREQNFGLAIFPIQQSTDILEMSARILSGLYVLAQPGAEFLLHFHRLYATTQLYHSSCSQLHRALVMPCVQ